MDLSKALDVNCQIINTYPVRISVCKGEIDNTKLMHCYFYQSFQYYISLKNSVQ